MQVINKDSTSQEDSTKEKGRHSKKFLKMLFFGQMALKKVGNIQRRYFKTAEYENCEKI